MEALFAKDFMPLWALALALALFFPVRQFIWVMYVRRDMRQGDVEEGERTRLKRRAGVTSALLCFVFAFVYTMHLFRDVP
jgi:hypothetical protein